MSDVTTPGPWAIEVLGSEDTESGNAETLVTAYGPDGATVATVNRWAYDDDPATPESEANARLISAAPDLKTACERALSLLAESEYDGVHEVWRINVVETLRAALSKAKGEG